MPKRCISRAEFGEDRTNVGYALYVRDNIKRDDYFRDITGGIHKMAYIDGNRVYYVFGDIANPYWVDIAAIKNFQENLLYLIEIGDVLEIENEKYEVIYDESYEKLGILIPDRKQLAVRHSAIELVLQKYKGIKILTHEEFNTNCYRVGG